MHTATSSNDYFDDCSDHYFEPWLSYKHPLVRQLAFAVASPNLIQNTPAELRLNHHFTWHAPDFWAQQYQHYQPRLRQLDQQPEALLNFLAKLKSTRLGLKFEYLIWFWLLDQDYHQYQILGHSLQIIEGRNTLGELDFLVLNRDTQVIEHWEVALKYYLAEADLSLVHWYGLNRDDTLFKKLNHFSQQQFKFTHAAEQQIEKRLAIVKGQLFLPTRQRDALLPQWINPERRLGHWGHQLYTAAYSRLNRQEWLCPDFQRNLPSSKWWSNGLYYNIHSHDFYMYRQAPLLHNQLNKT